MAMKKMNLRSGEKQSLPWDDGGIRYNLNGMKKVGQLQLMETKATTSIIKTNKQQNKTNKLCNILNQHILRR